MISWDERMSEVAQMAPATIEGEIAELRLLSSPVRLLGLYQLGLDGCARHESSSVTLVLHELISSLDYEFPDVADGFRRVYQYCVEQVMEDEVQSVAFIFQDLRDAVIRSMSATVVQHPPAPLLLQDLIS